MSGRWFRRTGVVAVLVVVATVVTSGGDLLRRGGWDANAGPGATTVAASKDDEHAKQLERDLEACTIVERDLQPV